MSSSLSSLLRGRGGGDLSFTCLGGRGGGRERGREGRLSKGGIDLLVLAAFLLGTGGVPVVEVEMMEVEVMGGQKSVGDADMIGTDR